MLFRIKSFSSLFLHPDYRWDSEYSCFEPHKNESLEYVPIGRVLASSQYGVSIEMNEEGKGTKIYRMDEIGNMLCDRHVSKYAQLDAVRINAYKLRDRDVLFNRTNSQAFVGRTGLYKRHSNEDHVFASYLVRLNPDPKTISPEYLTAFLNTTYGILDVKRRARISINQSNVNAEELKRVEIPLVSKELQARITSSFDSAFSRVQSSEAKHAEAQDILLEELGLADWRPKQRLAFVTNFSEVRRAGRMDADYFQPKYEDIVNAIKSYPGGWDTLGNLVTMQKSIEVGSKEYLTEGIPFVRVSNLSPFEMTEEKYISENLYEQIKENQPRQEEILFTKDATPGIAYYLRDEPQRMIPSGGVLRLKTKADRMDGEFLTLALNSMITKEQATRDAGGSVIRHWRPDQIARVVVPIPPKEVQARIQEKVVESAVLRQESKRLLECAKRSVEIAIEQDEETALKWLNKKTGEARIHA